MRHNLPLVRFVAILMLAWILGDFVGAGVWHETAEACPAAGSPSTTGFPHGHHSGQSAIHAGPCFCHGLATLADIVHGLAHLERLPSAPSPQVWYTASGTDRPIDHPPQPAVL